MLTAANKISEILRLIAVIGSWPFERSLLFHSLEISKLINIVLRTYCSESVNAV